ncbi:MAG: hypothetical protein NWF03_06720 [Candidatus Bathyarchaeota archaeon]|nr:hypothetical protein [Candidatus Bathyarchaeota archaeon]
MKKESSNPTKRNVLFTVIITAVMMVSSVSAVFADDILVPEDFKEESWSKTIDYLDYVDLYAVTHGKPRPPRGAEANIFMTYVNQSGVEMLYAGLADITMGYGSAAVTLPIQTFMMHYQSEDNKQDVVSASSYIMLMAYNESQNTLYEDSPDKNDMLYASFSMGFDLGALLDNDAPALNSQTTTTPLTHPDQNTWSWSMTYTNLTAIWWNIQIAADNASYQSIPVAITVYDELTFSYDLIFDHQSNTAQIVSNYIIGEMTDLWVIDDFVWIFPVIVHYNATGCYKLNKELYSTETIHQFLAKNNIDMSMVFFQASAILDHITESTVNGQDVSENEVDVSDETIVTESDQGERICSVDFGAKDTYMLYNSTSGTKNSYDAVVRTVDKDGYADNPVFATHTFLMNYIPLALAYIDEPLYEQYKDELLNMTYADYFYVISYPTYDGYKIEHDPIYTVFLAETEQTQTTDDPKLGGVLVLGLVGAVVIVAVVLFLRRKK